MVMTRIVVAVVVVSVSVGVEFARNKTTCAVGASQMQPPLSAAPLSPTSPTTMLVGVQWRSTITRSLTRARSLCRSESHE